MRTFQSQSQRGAFSTLHSLSSSAMSPLRTASITFAALLILTIPVCQSAPADLQQATADQGQLLREIDAMCSSYLSEDLRFLASDVLGELCVLMLVQKSKELNVRENSKRFLFHYSRPQGSVLSKGGSPQLHPLLRLVSQLNTRRQRGLTMHADLQGPGGIQSRGYFLYRPRNGRRSLEYE
ncbi:neuromedin-U isoform X1 [Maylandia zebra]|uniref:Neuromedin U C-terminal domain-containing protein n=1 Tax=Astatotilapia calliptera TaxID=8154 RepID=A0A3P8Q148_ASTCA|nr:neuromedin-U isoform X2 [Astatotilapia calliptera]